MNIKIEDNHNDNKKREPSEKLISLINEAVDTGVKLTSMIDEIWEQGAKEGFSREEIAEIVRPIARQRGLNKDQVYYLRHKPERQEQSRIQYQELTAITEAETRNITTFDNTNTFQVPKLELVFEHPEKDSWMYFKKVLRNDSVGLLFTYMFKDGTIQCHMCYDHPTNGLLVKFKRDGYIVRYCNGWIAIPKLTIRDTCVYCDEELKSFEDEDEEPSDRLHYGLLGCTKCDSIFTDSDKMEPGSLHERVYKKAEAEFLKDGEELVKYVERQCAEVLGIK